MRSLGIAVLSLSAALLASAASAAPVSPVELRISVGDYYVGTYNETQLLCTAGAEGSPTFGCQGTNLTVSDLKINSWNMTFDPDPVISGTVAVTNVGVSVQQFTLTFTMPTTVGPLSTMGGSIQGGLTDNTLNFTNAVLSTAVGTSLYSARIDGSSVQTLYNDPFSVPAPYDLGSANVAQQSFGLPGVTQPGPIVNTSIGIRIDFTLTPGDSASFTSVFAVLPIPEPGTGVLLVFGLGILALRRRR